ncbi:hypothetical protein D3C72_1325820 [compost metagenome]
MLAAANQRARPASDRIVHVLLHLVDRRVVDQRPQIDVLLKAGAHSQGQHCLLEMLGERVIDAVLYENPVRAHAGLAGIAKLGCHGAGHGQVEIGVIEHDEGRVATQLHRHFLHGARALLHQQLADAGRAGKRQFAHQGIAGDFFTNGSGVARHHVEHACGNAGFLRQCGKGEGRVGRGRGGLDDNRAAGGQRRAGFARDHRVREVPRSNGRHHPDRLLDHDNAAVGRGCGNDVAINAFRLFRKPFQE